MHTVLITLQKIQIVQGGAKNGASLSHCVEIGELLQYYNMLNKVINFFCLKISSPPSENTVNKRQ